MSLNYDLTGLPDELLTGAEDEITNALIWYAMFTGTTGELTEKTLPEFYARMQISDKLNGPILSRKGGDGYSITLDDLRKRIGMKTHVSNIGLSHVNGESRSAWLKRSVGSTMDEMVNKAKRELRETINAD